MEGSCKNKHTQGAEVVRGPAGVGDQGQLFLRPDAGAGGQQHEGRSQWEGQPPADRARRQRDSASPRSEGAGVSLGAGSDRGQDRQAGE